MLRGVVVVVVGIVKGFNIFFHIMINFEHATEPLGEE